MSVLDRLVDVPERVLALPRDKRGYPVPWFVAWHLGVPQFPVMDADKLRRAVQLSRCWICGEHLGRYRASVIGPMCAVNRTVAEPQSHLDCARFAARHCPFLTRPAMKRLPRTVLAAELAATVADPPGEHLEHNPGACALWVEPRRSRPVTVAGGVLFELGEPDSVEWYTEGRAATRAEVEAAVERGLPFLAATLEREPPGAARERAAAELERRVAALAHWLPAA